MWGVLAFLLLDPAAPAPPPRCEAIVERAKELLATGNSRAALLEYEKAIKCAPSEELHFRAAAAACMAGGRGHDSAMTARVKSHYGQLTTEKLKVQIQQLCTPPCDPFQLGAIAD